MKAISPRLTLWHILLAVFLQFDFPCIILVVFMTGIAKCVGWSHEAIAALNTLFRLHLCVLLFGFPISNDYKKTLLL